MADMENGGSTEIKAMGETPEPPLEKAKRIVETMCRQPKEAHWLGVRMENFLRAYGRKIETVGAGDVCDYLEGLMRKGQVEWQVKQSLDGIGWLMLYGHARFEA